MKQTLIRNLQSQTSLLIFCNGWAMNPGAVEHLVIPSDYDLLLLEDYRDHTFGFDFSPYSRVDLVGWSMGVWAASLLYTQKQLPPIERAIAIAGTPYPRHDQWGIPTTLFDATLDNLNEPNRARFNRRMCGGKTLKHLFEALQKRPTEEIKSELAHVGDQESFPPESVSSLWTHAVIPLRDRIIPPDNQRVWWDHTSVKQELLPQADHYPFLQFTHWEQLLTLGNDLYV